jgi:hypothetical protein
VTIPTTICSRPRLVYGISLPYSINGRIKFYKHRHPYPENAVPD